MGKSAYIGVGGVAKKVKSMYIGVGGVAKKIKKAWIGVGGVAKLFFSSEPSYHTTFDCLYVGDGSYTIGERSKAKNPSYAMFIGGNSGYADAFNKNLTHTRFFALKQTYQRVINTCGGWVGKYALNDWGYLQGEDSTKALLCWDESLTKTSKSEYFPTKSRDRDFAHLPNYALFTGGNSSSTYISGRSNVYSINESLSLQSLAVMSQGRVDTRCATLGDVAILAGGSTSTSACSLVVDTYNNSLTKGTASNLSEKRGFAASGTVGNYALFIAGYSRNTESYIRNMEIFNTSLTKTMISDDGLYSSSAGDAIELGEHLIVGLYQAQTVSMYDASLTKTMLPAINDWSSYNYAKMIDIGDYAIYGGGTNSAYATVYSI